MGKMIKIQLTKDLWLTSSSHSFEISKMIKIKDVDALTPIKYYSTLESAINGFVDEGIKRAHITSFTELRREVLLMKKKIDDILTEVKNGTSNIQETVSS